MSKPITITTAPCCWGVDDVSNPHLPAWQQVLEEASGAGFGGLELGPYGYLPLDLDEVGSALNNHGLSVVAGTIFDDLVSPSNRENLLRQTDDICALITSLPTPAHHDGQRFNAPYLTVMDWGHDERDFAAGHSGRPVEWPGSRPLTLEPELGPDFGGVGEWPLEHVVKVLCFCHPDDDAGMRAEQEATIQRLYSAARRNRLEFLLEIIPSKVGPVNDDTTAILIQRFYEIGIYPDWWKLEPMATQGAWEKTCATISANDPHTRGIVVLGLDAPEAELAASFRVAASFDLVKGFAVGRTIFGSAARGWLAGELSDDEAVGQMESNYRNLCQIWDQARSAARAAHVA